MRCKPIDTSNNKAEVQIKVKGYNQEKKEIKAHHRRLLKKNQGAFTCLFGQEQRTSLNVHSALT
jgi:hypothetical protein